MKNLISLSESVEELELSGGGSAEVHVSADGNYDETRCRLALTLDCSLRPLGEVALPARPVWLPGAQTLEEHVAGEDATTLARDIFRHWVQKVRRAIPGDAVLTGGTRTGS